MKTSSSPCLHLGFHSLTLLALSLIAGCGDVQFIGVQTPLPDAGTHACQTENHCILDGETPRCENGYVWENNLENYNCIKIRSDADAGSPDSGQLVDAGLTDAGLTDAGTVVDTLDASIHVSDAGNNDLDSGVIDTFDAGPVASMDAGPVASVDAGPVEPVDAGPDLFTGDNNRNILEGAISAGAQGNNKQLEVSDVITDETRGIVATQGNITQVMGSDYINSIIEIRNDGRSLCSVKVRVQIQDASGNQMATGDVFVHGSVGALQGRYTDTCLARGELGYLFLIRNAPTLYSEAVSTSIEVISSDYTADNPQTRIRPTSFTETSVGNFSIIVENVGDETTKLSVVSYLVLFNDDGELTGWSYLSVPQPSIIAPGATVSVYGRNLQHTEASTAMKVFVDFELY